MGKRGLLFMAAGFAKRQPSRCLGCQRPVVYGDRCPPCQQRLRARKRRKPR